MISNPIKFFVTGSEQKSFEYEGGKILFHFSPYDNGLSNTFEDNVVFFANDEKHAINVFKRMLKFGIQCSRERGPGSSGYSSYRKKRFEAYIDALNSGKIKLTKAPMNQFYIVGWASNDTL